MVMFNIPADYSAYQTQIQFVISLNKEKKLLFCAFSDEYQMKQRLAN